MNFNLFTPTTILLRIGAAVLYIPVFLWLSKLDSSHGPRLMADIGTFSIIAITIQIMFRVFFSRIMKEARVQSEGDINNYYSDLLPQEMVVQFTICMAVFAAFGYTLVQALLK